MKLKHGDLYARDFEPGEVILATTSASVDELCRLNMSAGASLDLSRRIPGLRAILGRKVRDLGCDQPDFTDEDVHDRPLFGVVLAKDVIPRVQVGSFQVKRVWWEDARLDIIANSVRVLDQLARAATESAFHVNAPGVGFGHLRWGDVLPLLGMLPDNVHIWRR